MNKIQAGIWSGILANGPMTLALMSMDRSSLPPAKLTDDLIEGARKLPPERRSDLSLISHFAFSTACGVLYSLVQKRVPGSPVAKGVGFGLGVWALSYFGWIPAIGSRVAGPKMSTRRNMEMLISHIVWGAALGRAAELLARAGQQMWDGEKPSPQSEVRSEPRYLH